MSTPRHLASLDFEKALATLALAGLRETAQAKHTATASANSAYTVTGAGTRRVMCFHTGAGAVDLRVRHNAAADGDNMPITPQTYWVIDAKMGDTINFYNTTLGAITVSIMELA